MVQPDGVVGGMSGGSIGNEFDGKRLDDIVGKEVAERILSEAYGDMRGNGLKVGGEGMKAFYDKIVPNAVKKLVGKMGGELGEVAFPAGKPSVERAGRSYYQVPSNVKALAQPGFTITDAMREKASGGLPLFSTGKRSTGLPHATVSQIVDAIKSRWANAPDVVVVSDMQDPNVPQAARDEDLQQRSQGATGTPEGFFYGGKVYVVASQIKTPGDVIRVLFHEALGHAGLRGVFGDSLNSILKQLIALRRADVQAKADQYGLDMNKPAEALRAAEEVLAEMAQTKPELGYVKRAIAAIKAWLRKHVPGFQSMKLTDAEIIQQYILPARRFVEGGGPNGGGPNGGLPVFGRADQTKSEAFKKWFGDSKVVDAGGKPLVVYHWTDNDFSEFDMSMVGEGAHFGTKKAAIDRSGGMASIDYEIEEEDGQYFVVADSGPKADEWQGPFATKKEAISFRVQQPKKIEPMAVYLNIKNLVRLPDLGTWSVFDIVRALPVGTLFESEKEDILRADDHYAKLRETLLDKGIDGFIYRNEVKDKGRDSYIAFSSTQIKSATGNNGDYSKTNRDINFSRSKIIGETTRKHTPEQLRAMKNVGFQVEVPTMKERAQALWRDAGKKLAQGIADQFAPIKDMDMKAYGLMRLSKGASGAFETLLHGGLLKLSDNVYDFDDAKRGGVVEKLLTPLQGEHHDFLRWVAANRAERLLGEGKENLFSPQDIADLKTLASGDTNFDYTIQNGIRKGQTTRKRADIYSDSLLTFNTFNKNVLDMAEQSGLIDGESRKLWEHEFYVPFYRVADDSDGGVRGMNIKGGVIRQQAFKQLKGGQNALNADLLDNTLMNWAHLLDASAKNRAAKATIEAAERLGIAMGGNQTQLAQMGKSINNKNGVVWFMDGGVKRYSLIDNQGDGAYLLTAISALEYAGMRSPIMNAMGFMKNALTIGVTASPFFKIRNLIRDSVHVIGTSRINVNPIKNVAEGWKMTSPKSDAYFRLLAGGGTIHFGTMLEGSEAKRIQALVESGVDAGTILNDDHKVKAFYRKFIEPGVTAYNELGNRGEAVNRASLYAQLVKQGKSHAEASLLARDLMDFSMQGSFTSIRFLTQVVPFFNARIQGMYKLGRYAKEDPARFATVVGAVSAISIGLLAASSGDDDWKRRADWDRNNFWWFKFGGKAFRIPKPFEIGAIATLAERGFELAFEKEMTATGFRKQVMTLLGDNLSMNPIPQIVKPIIDVYANKDSFTGKPIESMGMERLDPEYRFNGHTSMTARGVSTATNAVTGLVGVESFSPVQIDHVLRGYFGWLGAFVVGAADKLARPATAQATQATPDYWKEITGNMVSDLRDAPSKYVANMYDQARVIEQAYGTWRSLVKQGDKEGAQTFAADNRPLLEKYHQVERAKRSLSKLNERARFIERNSSMSADEKRVLMRKIERHKEQISKRLAPI